MKFDVSVYVDPITGIFTGYVRGFKRLEAQSESLRGLKENLTLLVQLTLEASEFELVIDIPIQIAS